MSKETIPSFIMMIVVIVILVLAVVYHMKTQKKKRVVNMSVFFDNAKVLSEEYSPEVKGYGLALVRASLSPKDLAKEAGKTMAKAMAKSIISGRQRNMTMVNNSDFYLVRYSNEAIQMFNIGTGFDCQNLQVKNDRVFCFKLADIAKVKFFGAKVSLENHEGIEITFELFNKESESALIVKKETEEFKTFLKSCKS